jgi:dihydrolipoamide dehydrogenase
MAGRARLVDPHTVEVATGSELRRIEGKHVLIATGSEPARPKIFPFDNQRVITSDEALELTQLPASILIVGGGIIGCEFASMWSELGAKVTIVEMLPRLLSVLDEDLSAEMYRTFRRSKVAVHLGVKIKRITSCDSGVRAELADGKSIEADIALIAVGRKLNSDLDGIASLGVKIERNALQVDEFGRTNIEGLYAAGDVTGRWLLAHYASEQAVVAAEHMFGSQPEPLKEDAIPNCVFTIPEIANVGLSEADARARGITCKVGRFPMLALGKAQAAGDTAGFVKLIADENGKVIGAHMIGHEVTSMIAEVTLAVRLGLKVNELIHTVHAHPTMPEGTHEAALDVFGRAIHK